MYKVGLKILGRSQLQLWLFIGSKIDKRNLSLYLLVLDKSFAFSYFKMLETLGDFTKRIKTQEAVYNLSVWRGLLDKVHLLQLFNYWIIIQDSRIWQINFGYLVELLQDLQK